jgi:hypothetical protein
MMQEPGRAERDFASVGTEATLKAFTCAFWDIRKGDVHRNCVAPKDKELSTVFHAGDLPSWYTEEDLKYCVAQFEKSGFTGPVNWYRNFGRYELRLQIPDQIMVHFVTSFALHPHGMRI